MKHKLWLPLLLLSCATALTGVCARADTFFPTKPIRLVVPFPAGGGTDVVARLLARKMGESLKQTIIVDNRAGANGLIGADIIAHAPADGYTIMLTIASHAIAPAVYKKLPYDTLKDFAPISLVATYPYVIVVPPSLPVKTFQEFIEYAKHNGGKMSYASSGNGSGPNLGMELLKQAAGIEMQHVPYKGAASANTDLVSGQVQAMLNNFLAGSGLIKAGRLRALAVTSLARSKAMPDLPTVAESGFPGFSVLSWYGLFAPKGTPVDVVDKLSQAAARAARDPDVIARMSEDGAEPIGSTPAEFNTFFIGEVQKWSAVAKKANITLDQ
jgi:tripartite-type tricarboxylate transporter receptor subunit TctC